MRKSNEKSFIKSANCNVDICIDGCGGIFFDNREYKQFDETHEDIDEILNAYKNHNYKKTNENLKRTCPVCKSEMVKNFASSLKQIEIDECYSCGGIFLDYKELNEIREQFKTESDRKEAFNKYFEQQHDISDFKDYEPKKFDELFGKYGAKIINVLNRIF